jgi:hypothetical protein
MAVTHLPEPHPTDPVVAQLSRMYREAYDATLSELRRAAVGGLSTAFREELLLHLARRMAELRLFTLAWAYGPVDPATGARLLRESVLYKAVAAADRETAKQLAAIGINVAVPAPGVITTSFALLNDHAGLDLGSVLGSVLGGGGQGAQILGHVFGDRQPHAAEAVGQTTGIGKDKAHMLLRWLAPIAMAYLAKRMFDQRHPQAAAATPTASTPTPSAAPSTTQSGTGASPGTLGDVLAPETEHARQGGLLDAVLGHAGAGLGDLLTAGSSILGGLGQTNRPPL